MKTKLLRSDIEGINNFICEYLKLLDSWQREVDNIRRMHHDVWKGSRLSPLVRQHRAGSRVEKQTRILPKGGQTDVDYMFEVIGIKVMSVRHEMGLYFKSNESETVDMSRTFGQVLASYDCKERLESDDTHGVIFNQTFVLHTNDMYRLVPSLFKPKVVSLSGLDYETDGKISDNCPSIAGFGAMNEYDGVPCLRLADWPKVTDHWIIRSNNSPFYSEWRRQTVLNVPLFLVPTGNPLSQRQSTEFRLSFSMVEISCFERLTTEMRTLYGIIKFVFKTILSEIELLSSYHVKTLMLWKVENKPVRYWNNIQPVDFLIEMIHDMNTCIKQRQIIHFFVDRCNIYPLHKHTNEKEKHFSRICEDMYFHLYTAIKSLAEDDLEVNTVPEKNANKQTMDNGEFETSHKQTENSLQGISVLCDGTRKRRQVDGNFGVKKKAITTHSDGWIAKAIKHLGDIEVNGPDAYISGYLTRLLSVITFSILENFEKSGEHGKESVDEITKLFSKYSKDTHINRLVPFVNTCVERLIGNTSMNIPAPDQSKIYTSDDRSIKTHGLFEALIANGLQEIKMTQSMEIRDNHNEIGISVTKIHQKLLPNDRPIQLMIDMLEVENGGRCPRFYLNPELFLCHLNIQRNIKELVHDSTELQALLVRLTSIVHTLSIKDPYLGKLSYRYAGVYLLRAYQRFVEDLGIVGVDVTVPVDTFQQRKLATNFDLR